MLERVSWVCALDGPADDKKDEVTNYLCTVWAAGN
jgi:hypothetical protein